MALHSTAQGLANLGRHGDSVLVHMQPQEVAGLQALAQSQGTSLTVNPNTGMPEAFNLGNFFKSLLPTLIGIGTGGAGLPLYAGIAAGAGVGALTNKDDPLMGALMGGLGGYGGQGIGSSLFKAGAPAVPAAATTAQTGAAAGTGAQVSQSLANAGANLSDPLVQDLIKQQVNSSVGTIPQQGMFNATTVNPATMATNLPYQNAQLGATQFMPGSGPNMGQVNPVTPNPAATLNTSGGYKPFGDISMENLSQTGRGFGNVLSGDEAALSAFRQGMGAESNLGAFGKSMLPVGGAVLGGIEPSDLGYGGPSIDELKKQTRYRGPSGQLNLDSNYNPETGEYEGLPPLQLATGGQVDLNPSVGGGLSDLYNRPEGATTQSLSNDGYGMGRLDRLAQQGSLSKAGDMFYAGGGPVSFADGGDTGMNLDELPSLNLNTGRQGYGGLGRFGDFNMSDGTLQERMQEFGRAIKYTVDNPTTITFPGIGPFESKTVINPFYTANKAFTQMKNNLSNRGVVLGPNMAKGGYLDGQGDGMSDSIPATIEGKQPARLADGEFVIPADVVSHLGNGSSKAGSKRLYAMLDKVRHARTGHTKQGKQINPAKYMPA
jgi:hypothetical protein